MLVAANDCGLSLKHTMAVRSQVLLPRCTIDEPSKRIQDGGRKPVCENFRGGAVAGLSGIGFALVGGNDRRSIGTG